MARLNANLRHQRDIWRRTNPFLYFQDVITQLKQAGVPIDFDHFDTDGAGHIDAWAELPDGRDITFSPDGPWFRGWHLTGVGGRCSNAPMRRMHPAVYVDPADVVAAVVAAVTQEAQPA